MGSDFLNRSQVQGTAVSVAGGNAGQMASYIRTVLLADGVIVLMMAVMWGRYLFSDGADALYPALVSVVTAALTALVTWGGLRGAARAPLESVMAWVVGGFLVRMMIVAGAVMVASRLEKYSFEVAVSIVVLIGLHTLLLVGVFARTARSL